MRAIVRNLVLSSLGAISKPRSGIFVLNGHFLSQECSDRPDIALHFLKKLRRYSEFMRLEDAARLIKNREFDSIDGVYLAFTFDDGFVDCYESIAPALDYYGTNAGFFINPNYVGADEAYVDFFNTNIVATPNKEPLTWQQISELDKAGFIIGNHTLEHSKLNSDDRSFCTKHIMTSKRIIERKLGKECCYFAWPYGGPDDISKEALDIALESHDYVFSGCHYKRYLSSSNRVINRRHFEFCWPESHLRYFLAKGKVWDE